jgi:hypothetical protein
MAPRFSVAQWPMNYTLVFPLLCFCLSVRQDAFRCLPSIPPRRHSIVVVQYGGRSSTNQRQAPARIGVWLVTFCFNQCLESISVLGIYKRNVADLEGLEFSWVIQKTSAMKWPCRRLCACKTGKYSPDTKHQSVILLIYFPVFKSILIRKKSEHCYLVNVTVKILVFLKRWYLYIMLFYLCNLKINNYYFLFKHLRTMLAYILISLPGIKFSTKTKSTQVNKTVN